MKKIILVDGNSLVFKAYYATAHTGNLLKAPNGKATNALRTTANIINKLIKDRDPDSILVAFDAGKGTFRHKYLPTYKAGRSETPAELKEQFPIIKQYLELCGIKHYELNQYEADDIIATFAKKAENQDMFVEIFSSDKDLLQLVSEKITVFLTNKGVSNLEEINITNFFEKYSYLPSQVIDIKGLMGDKSDNLQGVPGVGTKTAAKLIKEYGKIENIFANLDDQKGKLKENLQIHMDQALLCKKIAKLEFNTPTTIDIKDVEYNTKNIKSDKLTDFLKFYAMNSLLNMHKLKPKSLKSTVSFQKVNDLPENFSPIKYSINIETDKKNYNISKIIGLSISDENNNNYFIEGDDITNATNLKQLLESNNNAVVFSFQSTFNTLKRYGITLKNVIFDIQSASYLLDSKISQEIFKVAQIKTNFWDIVADEEIYGKGAKWSVPEIFRVAQHSVIKSNWIIKSEPTFRKYIIEEGLEQLYFEVELPSSKVISKMEINGVLIDKNEIKKLENKTKKIIKVLTQEIYKLAGEEFNIASNLQLGEILFNKLGLPGKKTKTGQYSTTSEILTSISDKHPIIPFIIQYRSYTKLFYTYILGLQNFILNDGRIHTNFLSTQTQTGRLSSRNPNLQNISVKTESQKEIRKVFVSPKGYKIAAFDYSQIELRILAHLSSCTELIKAFKENQDIHKLTASKVFGIPLEEVTNSQRNKAKAVNFGIIYGISGFGLSKQLKISVPEANNIIKTYKKAYHEIEEFRQKCIKEAKDKGFVSTLMNRKRFIPELQSSSYLQRQFGERAATNAPIQGASADIIKKAMVNIDSKLNINNIDAKMVMQVHDELVFEIKEEHLQDAKDIIIKEMEKVLDLKIDLVVNWGSGNSLYEIK